MNCEICNSRLSYTTECEGVMYCRQCKKLVGECNDIEQTMFCKKCGSEVDFSTDGRIAVCKKCGEVQQVGEEREDVKKEPTPQMPPLKEQAANFAGSMVNFAKSGFKTCGEEEKERRLEICRGCALFDSESVRCTKCGCALKYKAGIEGEKCPLGLWDKDKN